MSPRFMRQVDVLRGSDRSAEASPRESSGVARRARVRALAVHALAALAFVVTVLLPLRASATIIPTCEHDAVTWMPIAILESSCDAPDDVVVDGSAAPICDPAGASAIAPLRLLPVADGRIDAVPHCGDASSIGPMIGPRGGDHPAMSSPAILDQAMLAASLFVPPAPFVESVALPDPAGGPRAGVTDDVYHPPR